MFRLVDVFALALVVFCVYGVVLKFVSCRFVFVYVHVMLLRVVCVVVCCLVCGVCAFVMRVDVCCCVAC